MDPYKSLQNKIKKCYNRNMKQIVFLFFSSFLIAHEMPFSQYYDFFPIQDENVWVYSANLPNQNDNYFFIQAQKKGDSFFIYNYFRTDEDFEIFKKANEVFFGTEKEKFLIYDFEKNAFWHIPEKISIKTPCIADSYIGVIEDNITFSTPAGIFNGCIRVLWDSPCKDSGIIEEVFAPNVGLLRRVENRIFGTLSFNLIYAYVNGVVYGKPTISISGGISPEYLADSNLVNIQIYNNTSKEMLLTFPTSQIYDLILENENGDLLYQWSNDQSFIPAITNKAIAPYDQLNYSILVQFPKLEKGMYYLKITVPVAQINSIPSKNPLLILIPVYRN